VGRPRFPVFAALSPIHCSSANRDPRRVPQTFDLNHGGTTANVHCRLLGNGKWESKAVQNALSERGGGTTNRFGAFAGRDAMSAKMLSVPGTWTVVSLPASL
jgi:hypothetical protein